MKKKNICLFLVILSTISTCIAIFLIGCTLDKKSSIGGKDTEKHENKQNNSQSSQIKNYFPYTGEECDKTSSENIAFMAIVENSSDARPQSGLSQADVVFETMAEGGIQRFIAIFQKNSPECIGPIRSARPYFIDISLEYKLAFAHCGGSSEALDKIEKDNLMSINELKYGKYFYRDSNRKAPHNLYTTSGKIKEFIKEKNYTKAYEKLSFDKDYWIKSKAEPLNCITISTNKNYSTSYQYKNGLYYKSMDGKIAEDKNNNSQIAVKNIVIQLTNITLQNDNNHLDIALVGEGDGYIISSGKYEKIKWYKKDKGSKTILKNQDGDKVCLNPGNTFWHIIDKNSKIDIEK